MKEVIAKWLFEKYSNVKEKGWENITELHRLCWLKNAEELIKLLGL
jgi:hypothetical protein